MATPAASVDPL